MCIAYKIAEPLGITYTRNFCLVPISTAPDRVSFLSQGGLPRGMMCKLGSTYAPPSQARPGAGARLAPLVLVLCPSPGPPGRGLAPGRGSKDIFTAIITQYQRNRTAACNRGPLPCMSRARQNHSEAHSISKHKTTISKHKATISIYDFNADIVDSSIS